MNGFSARGVYGQEHVSAGQHAELLCVFEHVELVTDRGVISRKDRAQNDYRLLIRILVPDLNSFAKLCGLNAYAVDHGAYSLGILARAELQDGTVTVKRDKAVRSADVCDLSSLFDRYPYFRRDPYAYRYVGDIRVLIPYLLTINMSTDSASQEIRAILLYLGGLFAVLGHMFPIYYKFKGGKGVVTTASVMLMTDWRVLVAELIIFGVFFVVSKTISKCSLLCAGSYPFVAAAFRLLDSMRILSFLAPIQSPTPMFIVCVFVITFINGAAIIILHKDNIKRILNGTEKKITEKHK